MKKKFKLLLSALFIAIGLLLVLEGKFQLSLTDENHLDKKISEQLSYQNVELVSSSKKEGVRIDVFYDGKDTLHIVEITKNSIFDLYSISEINEVNIKGESYNSVISSALNDYAYSINLEDFNITIFEPNISSNAYYSMCIIILGGILLIRTIMEKEV